MIGIGTDLVQISRMTALLYKHGDRIAEKILTIAELEDFQHAIYPAAFLAKRFAAKEATVKAFGTGFRDGLSLRHIGVKNDALGRPLLCFYEQAEKIMIEQKISKALLSLSDDGDYALAFVTLS
jgi:holo-[acyl-carrier protein] synthase